MGGEARSDVQEVGVRERKIEKSSHVVLVLHDDIIQSFSLAGWKDIKNSRHVFVTLAKEIMESICLAACQSPRCTGAVISFLIARALLEARLVGWKLAAS